MVRGCSRGLFACSISVHSVVLVARKMVPASIHRASLRTRQDCMLRPAAAVDPIAAAAVRASESERVVPTGSASEERRFDNLEALRIG